MPFWPPVSPRSLDHAVLDDEAEGDRDHRQVRSLHAQRRQRQQVADAARQHRASGHASQKLKPALVVRIATA